MSKIICVAIENDVTDIGYFEDERLAAKMSIGTTSQKTIDEYEMILHYFIHLHHIDIHIERCVVCSVVPEVTDNVVNALENVFGKEILMIGPGIKTGIFIQNASPKEIGADRIANVSAMYHLYQGNTIVVSFGTAITFDYVDLNGVLKYTVIAPGIETSSKALKQSASKLPSVAFVKPNSVLGKDTVSGIQAGMYYGFKGLVEGILYEMQKKVGKCKVIACGRDASVITSKYFDDVIIDLTLQGLQIISTLN